MASAERRSCRFGLPLAWKSGRHTVMWKYCGYWSCKRCKREKIETICTQILALSEGVDFLYTVRGNLKQSQGIRKAMQKSKASRLGLSLVDGGLFAVSTVALSGRGWTTAQYELTDDFGQDDLPGILYGLEITRQSWGGGWKVDRLPPIPLDNLVYRGRRHMTPEEWRARLEKVGVNPYALIPDAETVAGKLRALDEAEDDQRWETKRAA